MFGQETFHALSKVTGDKGGLVIFNQFKVNWLDWGDKRILMDVDSLEDLEKLQRAYSSEA